MAEVEPKAGLRIRTRNLRETTDSQTEQILWPGDEIVYQVTHEVTFNGGEKMWVRFGTGSTVRPDETTEQATDRLVNFVHKKALEAAQSAVESVQSFPNKG